MPKSMFTEKKVSHCNICFSCVFNNSKAQLMIS